MRLSIFGITFSALLGVFFMSPSWAQNTLPLNAIPYSRGPGVTTWSGITVGANKVITTNGSSVPTASSTLPAANFPALTGNVTTSAGSLVTTIGAAQVTNAMLAGSIDLTTKVTGILPGANFPALTGNVTTSAGSLTTTIASSVITNAMLAGGTYSAITGFGTVTTGTLNGLTITGLASPSGSSDAANKSYVDSVASGVKNIGPSRLATAAVLPNTPTYSNGASGVGATLTAGSNTTLTVDGSVAALNNIILVKDQASAFQNGQYYVSAAGDGSNPWILTRCTAAACAQQFNTAATMLAGSYTFITAGSTNINNAYSLQSTVATVGTTAANFVLFSGGTAGVSAVGGQTGALSCSTNINCVAGVLSVPTAGSTGYVQFNGTSNAFGADSNIFWDNTNKRLGVGATTLDARLHVEKAFSADSIFGGETAMLATSANTSDQGPTLSFGSATANFPKYASISGRSAGGGTYGGYLSFYTANASSAYAERMRIDSSGIVRVSGLTTCQAAITADASGNFICGGAAASVAAYNSLDCTGAVAGQAAFVSAYTAYSTVLVPVGCTIKISSGTTFPAGKTLIVPCGATITVDNGITLAINGYFPDPGLCQVFAGAGTVTGIRFNRPEYFGAAGNCNYGSTCATDDQPYVQKAINSAQNSTASDGGRPTIQLGAGRAYGLCSPVTLSPTLVAPVALKGTASYQGGPGTGGSWLIGGTASCTNSTYILHVDGQVAGGSIEQTNFELSNFGARSYTSGSPVPVCIQLGSNGKSISGLTKSLVQNVYVVDCQIGWLTDGDVHEISFHQISISEEDIPTGTGFKINAAAGQSVTELDFNHSRISGHTNTGWDFNINADGSGASVHGIKFDDVNFYHSDKKMYITSANGGTIGDIWCTKCQFDGGSGVTGQSAVVITSTGTAGPTPSQVSNVQFHGNYYTGIQAGYNAVKITASGGGTASLLFFDNSMFSGMGAISVINVTGVSDGQFNHNTFSGIQNSGGAAIDIYDSSGVHVIGNSVTLNSSALTNLVTFQGTTKNSIACMNSSNGTTTPALTAILAGGGANNFAGLSCGTNN